MDAAYQNALAQREALGKRISKMEQQLEAARFEHERAVQFIENWEHFAHLNAPKIDSGVYICGKEQVRKVESKESRPRNPSKESVAEMAVQVLLAHGKPMSRAELFAALTDNGLVLHGKEPIVVLSTMLWRMKEVVSFVSGLGYWPVGHEMPGRQILNGRVVQNHLVTEADTNNKTIIEAAQKFYPDSGADHVEREEESLFL